MSKKLVLAAIFISFFFAACKKNTPSKQHQTKSIQLTNNKFYYTPTLKTVLKYHNQRDVKNLIKYLNDSLPQVRYYTLLSLGSLHDTSHLYPELNMLNDTNSQVRLAAAYTIELQRSHNTEDILIKHYYNESNPAVREQILEALGRCGSSRTLYFLSKVSPTSRIETQGLAWALVYSALRGMTSTSCEQRALELLTSYKSSNEVKRIISQYFYQPSIKIKDYYKQLIHVFYNSEDTILKINLIKAVSNITNQQIIDFLKQNLNSQSQELRIAAAQGLAKQHNPDIPQLMAHLTTDHNSFVAQTAAEYFIYHGLPKEANYYFELARTIHKWLPRSLLLHAALKYAPDTLKEKFANSIITGFKATKNDYEKSYLLSSMAFYPPKYEFVRDQAFYATQRIISTTAARTLVKMRLQPDFYKIAQKYYKEQGIKLNKEFSLLFKEIMKKGDNAQIFYASEILRLKKLNLLQNYENTSFINQALAKLQFPRDIRVFHSVCRLYKLYTGDTCSRPIYKMSEIDWSFAQKIPNKTLIRIRTIKGDIIIKLYPEQAPATVSTFLKLVTQGYYNDTYIVRSIPNMSVWASSRRGDSWPDVNIAHPVMLYPYHFEPGTIAMNLIDNGVESVQWFIVLNPTPGMDGHYTAFGKVIKGMSVARSLEVGDQIIAVEIY